MSGITTKIQSMTSFRFGEIVLVPFPFTDQSATKQRPAVVISSTAYNLTRPDLILMAITSQIRQPVRQDEIEIAFWRETGLLKPSVIKPVVTTVEKSLILKRLGSLEMEDSNSLRTVLHSIVG